MHTNYHLHYDIGLAVVAGLYQCRIFTMESLLQAVGLNAFETIGIVIGSFYLLTILVFVMEITYVRYFPNPAPDPKICVILRQIV